VCLVSHVLLCAFDVDENGHVVPCKDHFKETLRQINMYHQLVCESNGQIGIITKKSDLESVEKSRLSFVLAVEGADSIDEELINLETFYNLGVRSIGLTWSYDNKLAGGCNDNGPLTELGKKTIQRMEKLGILLDLAHIGEKSFFESVNTSTHPVVISHTCCMAVNPHPRNVTDDQIKIVAQSGGLIGICGVPKFVGDRSIKGLVKHFIHAIDLIGVDHVMVGSDLGSMTADELIPEFEDVADMPGLVSGLKEVGLSDRDLDKITHENVERLLEKIL
jgi:membrane dipeptidase